MKKDIEGCQVDVGDIEGSHQKEGYQEDGGRRYFGECQDGLPHSFSLVPIKGTNYTGLHGLRKKY